MLVLTRMAGEAVDIYHADTKELIGRVMVTEIRGNRAKLGFELPSRFALVRAEFENPAFHKCKPTLKEQEGTTDGLLASE